MRVTHSGRGEFDGVRRALAVADHLLDGIDVGRAVQYFAGGPRLHGVALLRSGPVGVGVGDPVETVKVLLLQ